MASDKSGSVPLQGWQCPSCGAVYSPFTAACGRCGPRTYPATTTSPLAACPYCHLPYHMCRGHNTCAVN